MLDFLDFSFLDALDIILVAILLYYVYKLLKGTVAINIFIGIALVVLIWKITEALQMKMLSGLLGALISLGAIAILIVFQPEVRKFLLMIGSTNFTNKRNFLKQINFLKTEIQTTTDVESIVTACEEMAITKTGVLIVLERTQNLDFVKFTGDKMNIEINKPIIKSIFYKNSPLHDGAIIIKENFIIAARVILPLSNKKLPARFGLRHKAAIGITEKTDALCLVVSEETGKMSYIKDGEFVLFKNSNELIETIRYDLN
ncbi:Diadenylate cyclase spyDAC; Bacterial checkpoint controller DisA with nucleotide-binding domain [hydrothermal vent metagenome]|uniref:Diadenylate cyclase spyDAC Bacterial checkpoint controller DisA with nucleotide-binding domain n=1 Tax=hydrothermal vent metagenome TaxID=652676 RepID=A0A3B0UL95_9ZZZZ